MGRKITMTGKNAQYIEHRGMNATPDADREIRMEGDEAVYQEFAYGQPGRPDDQREGAAESQAEDVTLLTTDDERVAPNGEADVVEQLKTVFYNNEEEARLFLREIAGMRPGDVTELVNRWVSAKRISDYGNTRKGALWKILHDAGLYTKSRQNWCRRVR